jgi:hypothetical protein
MVLLFSLFFGPQISLYVGLGVGYLSAFGYLKWFELGAARATVYESKFLFRKLNGKPCKSPTF